VEKEVSIIIPTKDALPLIKQCLLSIQRNTVGMDYEVIVVDNASKDGTTEFVTGSELTLDGKYIRNKENKSFSVANNQGVSIAKGNYLCFLNNDTLVTRNWLVNMLKVFKEEDNIGIVGARLVHPGRGTIQHAGVIETASGLPDHIYFNKPMNYPPAMERKDYFAVTGACMLMPKKLFDDLGGFDETYWYGWEDIDMANKVKELGKRIVYEPTAVVYHYESRTSGRYLAESSNFGYYMKKWVLNKA